MAVINNSIENTLSNIAAASKFMNLDILYICTIVLDDTLECEVLELEEPCKVVYMEIGIKFFMERLLDNPDMISENITKILYILRDGNYSNLKELFTIIQEEKVNIVRGSSQKSHIVSPIDLRLSCYLMILHNMDFGRIASNNSFNILTKDRYLPSFK